MWNAPWHTTGAYPGLYSISKEIFYSPLDVMLVYCRVSPSIKFTSTHCFIQLGPVVQGVDNTIHWINHYPKDKCSYPLDLSTVIYPVDSIFIHLLNNQGLVGALETL